MFDGAERSDASRYAGFAISIAPNTWIYAYPYTYTYTFDLTFDF